MRVGRRLRRVEAATEENARAGHFTDQAQVTASASRASSSSATRAACARAGVLTDTEVPVRCDVHGGTVEGQHVRRRQLVDVANIVRGSGTNRTQVRPERGRVGLGKQRVGGEQCLDLGAAKSSRRPSCA